MKNLKQEAFSLIELMVVVVLIGILVSLSLPRFRTFVAKSRMAEAVHNLGIIDRLQKSYNLHWEMFGQDDVWFNGLLMGNGSPASNCTGDARLKNKLGFRVEECDKLRYDYTANGANSDDAVNVLGHQRIYPGCQTGNDEWEIFRAGGTAKTWQRIDIIEHCE